MRESIFNTILHKRMPIHFGSSLFKLTKSSEDVGDLNDEWMTWENDKGEELNIYPSSDENDIWIDYDYRMNNMPMLGGQGSIKIKKLSDEKSQIMFVMEMLEKLIGQLRKYNKLHNTDTITTPSTTTVNISPKTSSKVVGQIDKEVDNIISSTPKYPTSQQVMYLYKKAVELKSNKLMNFAKQKDSFSENSTNMKTTSNIKITKGQLKSLIKEILSEEAPAPNVLPSILKGKLPADHEKALLNLKVYEIIANFIDSDLQQKVQAANINDFVDDFGIKTMAQAIKNIRFNVAQ